MKVLVTGGAGFIGTHLTKTLLSKGHSVIVIDDLSTGDLNNVKEFISNENYQFYNKNIIELKDTPNIKNIFKSVDVIYHLASVVGVALVDKEPHKTIKDNLELGKIICSLAEQFNKKVIFASTSEVYGDQAPAEGFKESDTLSIKPPTKLRWGYASTKLTQEFLIHSYNFPFVVVRLFNVVGPKQKGDFGMVLPRFINWAKNNEDIIVYGNGKQSRCFCHIKDCIKVLYKIGVSSDCDGEIINIGNPEEISMAHLAERVIQLTGSSSKIVYVPYEQYFSKQHEDIFRRIPNIDKLKKLLNYVPLYNLDKIIKDML